MKKSYDVMNKNWRELWPMPVVLLDTMVVPRQEKSWKDVTFETWNYVSLLARKDIEEASHLAQLLVWKQALCISTNTKYIYIVGAE